MIGRRAFSIHVSSVWPRIEGDGSMPVVGGGAAHAAVTNLHEGGAGVGRYAFAGGAGRRVL
jgi:hypothetical protein